MKKIIVLFPIALILCFILLKLKFNNVYTALIQEDTVIESLQFGFYLAASWVALLIAKDFRASRASRLAFLYIMFALVLLIVSLEEISWGQRVFGFHGLAAIVDHNIQKEFTVHNLKGIQSGLGMVYIVVGFLTAFSELLLPGRLRSRCPLLARYILPDRLLFFYFSPTFAIYFYFFPVSDILVEGFGLQSCRIDNVIVWRDQEPAELLLSLGFLLFVLMTKHRQELQLDLDRGTKQVMEDRTA